MVPSRLIPTARLSRAIQTLCLIFTLGIWAAPETSSLLAQDGETLFKQNCGACHAMDKKVTGPALQGVHDRWNGDEAELTAFIKNPTAYKDNGKNKAYVQKLFDEFKMVMPPQASLGDANIKLVLDYIKGWTPPAAAAGTEVAAGGGGKSGGDSKSGYDDMTIYFLLASVVAVLLFVCVVLVIVIAVVGQSIRSKEKGEPLTWTNVMRNISALLRSKFVVTVVVLIVLVGGANVTWSFLMTIGLHDGYKPVQPVAFSHKLHAGTYKIDCQYCHIGVSKGKSATIPSTNICMNCHTYIEQGPKYGKTEIAKVRDAHAKGVPIEWVRIHNLPDLVYFNHSQHVKVAGLECQRCHGPVQEMEEVYQFSRLSMGWCVECHRTEKVDIEKNDYYRSVHQGVRDQIQAGDLTPDDVTVEKLGGLECARCHY